MSDRAKMILKLIGLFAVAGLIGLGMYFLFFVRPPTIIEEPSGGEPTTPGGLPGAQTGGITPTTPPTGPGGLPPSSVAEGGPTQTIQLTSSSVTSPTLTSSNTVAYYDPRDGKFYTIDSNGNVVALSDATFPKAETVVFSGEAEKAAIEFPDGSNVLYDFATDTQTTLPSHWTDFEFSTDAEQVVSKSLGSDVNSRVLVITDADGQRTQAIAALGDKESRVTPSWSPTNNIVAFSETGSTQSAFGRREIYLLDTNGEATESIIVDGTNFSGVWSPGGNSLLYSVADAGNNSRASLWYVVATGTNAGGGRMNLSVETWVEKCTFGDETTVYCAVPREGANQSGIDHRLVTSFDDIYRINVTTGRTSLVGSPVFDMQMSNLRLSDDGSILYFTDMQGRLNYMRLK